MSRLVADHKTHALAIMASGCITIVPVETIFDRINLIWRKVVPGFYVNGHIARPEKMAVMPP